MTPTSASPWPTRARHACAVAACIAAVTASAAFAGAASAPAARALPPSPVKAHHGAPHAEPQPLQNVHTPFVGDPFFLLTDASFAAGEPARVRLEVNNPGAFDNVGGVDVRVYRLADPLDFLQRQRNLHRIQVDAKPADEGVANTLTHLFDSWSVKARDAWRGVFSGAARGSVTKAEPALKTSPHLHEPSSFEDPPQFAPLPGLPVVERFRYPVQHAQAIEPPKDIKLEGSSSEFIKPTAGNVFVPVGRRAPGLYLVEAMAGSFRATTLLFVSDSVAVTKIAGDQMLVWTARRQDGAPVPGTRVVWTDGVGTLKTGQTDAQGLASLDRHSPEQSYVFGVDPAGGAWISENFYYDSEIYSAKVYAVTDRPLYRPGDTVQVHVTGREFKSARDSVAMKDADLVLSVVDPTGQPMARATARFSGRTGGDASFVLPDNAPGGGYEMRLVMGDDAYTAAFRVAEYQKPHFEIALQPDKADFTTGQAITGQLQLHYPDGKPVAHASVSLAARAQRLTMVEGELDYGGQFPLRITTDELTTDANGVARFALPAANEPSRYILTALATDGAAYRVRTSRELLVERGSTSWRLTPDRQFSQPGQAVSFRVSASQRSTAIAGTGTGALPGGAGAAAAEAASRPVSWDWVRQEDRQTASGKLAADAAALDVTFPQPGSYTLTLRDARHRIVAATSHFVSGPGLKAPAGSIGIVFDHAAYHAGDTAEALVSFPEPVENALLTLERDRVEATALLGRSAGWVQATRLNPTQWKLRVPVKDTFSPNVTLSIAYLKNGDYVFQNQGLLVAQPRIELAFRTAKAVYAPGERVDVDVTATLGGKPVVADVNVGVVDEMIYVLQPEIAPRIEDFFFHPRRDNVRTSVSLSFIGYDLATSRLGDARRHGDVQQRAIKVLERPRREDVDTAAWIPRLATDAAGHARFTFVMPDSLTRWRVTGRAVDAAGDVGQQTAWVRSDKPFYAKWTSPDWQREGDQARAAVALFNQTGADAAVAWSVQGAGVERQGQATLKPGVNFVDVPLVAEHAGTLPLHLVLRRDGQVVDQLDVPLRRLPVAWRAPREVALELGAAAGPALPALSLPADATRLRVSFAQDAAGGTFSRWMDQLVEFPYGCVEQTASRMLPLSIALQSLSPAQQAAAPMLAQRLATARLRLAQMAGPEARFAWWGGKDDDAFLTAYAYYADWRATQALHLTLPASHWQYLLDVYAKGGARLPVLQRALALQWMQEMGLPVSTMAGALVDEITSARPGTSTTTGTTGAAGADAPPRVHASLVLADDPPATTELDAALVLATAVADRSGAQRPPDLKQRAEAAAMRLSSVDAPFVQALLMATQHAPATTAPLTLGQVGAQGATFDRAQTLVWLQRALGRRPGGNAGADATPGAGFTLPAPWVRATGPSGEPQWRWPEGQTLPATLALPAGAHPAWAWVDFDSAEPSPATLPVHLERTLWRLVPRPDVPSAPASAASSSHAAAGDGAGLDDGTPAPEPGSTALSPDAGRMRMVMERVAPGTPLSADAVYLDEVMVRGSQPLNRALLEVALPPGAAVESGTWGITLERAGQSFVMERARHQDTAQGYAVPVDLVPAGETLAVRHLVRFSQRGQFRLPPVRLYRMYDPDAKAVDGSGAWAKVEVR